MLDNLLHRFSKKTMTMKNAFKIVQEFEKRIAEYTGSHYAVAIDSGTNALFLCCKYLKVKTVTIPRRTYVGVANSIIHAGGKVKFRDEDWKGIYQLKPYPIYDAAKRFTKGMYISNSHMCLSFHGKKHLKIGRGGMILTNNKKTVEWFKKARWDGRTEGIPLEKEKFDTLGWNMYMLPEQAARGLTQMMFLSEHNKDLPTEPYSDLSQYNIFQPLKRK